ncbi:hypothetical protein [Tropicibacter oceani]|uniref:Uncharacterized protein n=1 Tax=Tropicibacter oceani TaxID=3058420 RepID=A0ABY8QJ19_9RHOB|nr:hypothetical protein [Tropicibacter oceani]WGW04438.1 hypothetical protein QF118_02515 [Tropicibacter oceani]
MSRATKLTLIGIAVFFLAVVLSFVLFVVTWNPEATQSLTHLVPHSKGRLT